MEATTALVVFIIFVALIFDYTNGMHDAANSIATVVSTRVLSPGVAVAWAAFFNFIAFAVFGTAVAKMIGGGLVDLKPIPQELHLYVLLAGLIGVIAWNLITWYLGLADFELARADRRLCGRGDRRLRRFRRDYSCGLVSDADVYYRRAADGNDARIFFDAGGLLDFPAERSVSKVDKGFRVGQLFSAAAYSLGHGGNDAQKTMGIITAVLVAGGFLEAGAGGKLPDIPLWVVLSAHAAIGLGTLTGGWRIVKTMGSKITKLQPVGGFCAETAGAITLAFATHFGIPVSTTHTITGAIVGVGSTKRLSAVKWGVAGRIVWAWILTIPMAGLIAAVTYFIILLIHRTTGF